MSAERIIFSSPLATRIRTGKPHFESDESKFKTELAKRYAQTEGKVCAARVHPDITQFCSTYWHEQSQRLQFETKRTYAECSREIARREPWVYFCRAEAGAWEAYDVDLPRTNREEDDE